MTRVKAIQKLKDNTYPIDIAPGIATLVELACILATHAKIEPNYQDPSLDLEAIRKSLESTFPEIYRDML